VKIQNAALLPVDPRVPDRKSIQLAAECLVRGGLVAFPTETVYGLGGNAFDAAAVKRIFEAKGRPFHDPLIVHLASIEDIPEVAAEIPDSVAALGSRFWPGPLTLILPRRATVPPEVSAGLETVAVRVPSHPVARALLLAAGIPVAAPSANRFGHISATLARHVVEDLGGRIDMILDAGPTDWGVESTILDPLSSPPVLLRPGGISREELERILGPIRIAAPAERLNASPGRQPRHYAPYARLILCAGDSPQEIAASIQTAAERLLPKHRRIGLLAVREVCARIDVKDDRWIRIDLGPRDDLRQVSGRLFAGLRELETEGAEVILAHRLPPEGLGAAINDRLSRAAEDINK
jgi:L-threonylcarbamoyladenylate synthase